MPQPSAYAAKIITARAAAVAPTRPEPVAPYHLPELIQAVAPRSCAHAISVIDDHGRIRPGDLLSELGWGPETRLSWRPAGAAVVLAADPAGPPGVDAFRRLRLPLAARRALSVRPGSRVLASAAPGRLVINATTILDVIVEVPDAWRLIHKPLKK